MTKVTVIYHSGHGHTKAQAEHVLKGVQSISGVTASLVTAEDATKNLDSLADTDCMIFGCPTYMGSLSAGFKTFIEAASSIWFKQGWKDKLAAGFTNSQSPSGDKLGTLNSLYINAMQHGMIWVSTGFLPGANGTAGDEELNRLGCYSGAMAQSPQGSKEPLPADLKTAEVFGKRVAEVAVRWVKNK